MNAFDGANTDALVRILRTVALCRPDLVEPYLYVLGNLADAVQGSLRPPERRTDLAEPELLWRLAQFDEAAVAAVRTGLTEAWLWCLLNGHAADLAQFQPPTASQLQQLATMAGSRSSRAVTRNREALLTDRTAKRERKT